MHSLLTDVEVADIQGILMRQLGVDREQLIESATVTGDLGADSLDVVEIGMLLEERFNLAFPDEEWDEARTVGDLYDLVGAHVSFERTGATGS